MLTSYREYKVLIIKTKTASCGQQKELLTLFYLDKISLGAGALTHLLLEILPKNAF